MYFQPEIETMSREELLDLQLERMKWCVQYAYDNVPFYQKSFKDAGVEPGDLKTLEDITKFPFILKQDMRDNYPDGLFAVPRSKVVRLHASSGTTGQATMQIAYGYGLFTGGLGAHRGGETAGCAVIPISSGNTKRQIQMLKDMQVDVLACTPSYALHIADTAIEMGINPATDLKVRAGIFGAEPCSQGMRDEIAEKLGVQYCDVYGLSEVMGPGVAFECKEMSGLHLAEDHFFAEIIDPDTLQPVPDGEYGELVFTTLTRECCPLVRYRTRDITRIISEPCACGRTHRKIDRIIGRSDDMLILRGVNVFPSQIEQVLTGFPEIATQYQIILTTRGPLDHVELRVETVPEFPFDEIRKLETLKKRLAAELKGNLQIAVDIKLVEPKSIERSEGKAKRIIDLRKE